MDKNAVIDKNCEDDIPLLEVRTSPDSEESIQKVTSGDLKDSASSACDESIISKEPSSEDKQGQADLETKAPTKTATSEKVKSDQPQEPPNNSTIIVQQKKKLNCSENEETSLIRPTPQAEVIPSGNEAKRQRIKVDISHLPILSPAPLNDSPVRKLELTAVAATPEVVPVKMEEDNDDTVT